MPNQPPHHSDTPTGLVTHRDLDRVRVELAGSIGLVDGKIETVRKDVSMVSGDVGRLAVENAKQTQKLDLLLKQKDRADDVSAHGEKVKMTTSGKIKVAIVGLLTAGGGALLHWASAHL